MTASPSALPVGSLEREIRSEIVSAERPDGPLLARVRRVRVWISRHPRLQVLYRIAVALGGTVLTLGGLILVPLPGPGWLVVFLGLAVLGTEFHWARRLSARVKRALDRFWRWWRARRAARTARTAAPPRA